MDGQKRIELNEYQRMILFNQFDIIRNNEESEYDKEYVKKYQDILSYGFESEYQEIFQHIRRTTSYEDCEFVKELFEMYNAISKVYLENTEEFSKDEERKFNFAGFDGNNSSLYSYTRFLAKNNNYHYLFKLKGIKDNDSVYDEFNSHGSNYGVNYSGMLRSYKEILEPEDKYWTKLTVEDARTIIANR